MPVVPRAREILIKAYEQYLFELRAKLEAGTPYRDHMEKFIQHRLDICNLTTDYFEIEERIGCGQLEEMIDDIENEYSLIPFMVEHRPWEQDNKRDCAFQLYSDIK